MANELGFLLSALRLSAHAAALASASTNTNAFIALPKVLAFKE